MADGNVIVAALSLAGTAIGTFGGIMTANKLTNYRIQQLEKKVDEHNSFARRMPSLEEWRGRVEAKLEKIDIKFEEIEHERRNRNED